MWQPAPYKQSTVVLNSDQILWIKHLFKIKGDEKVKGQDEGSFRQGEGCRE